GGRKKRDERLVEMEDVEALLGQQLARLLLELPAQGDAAHAAVGREGKPCAQADDVPLVDPLLAVLAGDDPHVVAHLAQRVIRMAHVLIDPTWMGVAVRAYDADPEGLRRSL